MPWSCGFGLGVQGGERSSFLEYCLLLLVCYCSEGYCCCVLLGEFSVFFFRPRGGYGLRFRDLFFTA